MTFNRAEFLKSMAMLDLLAIPFLENEEFQASRLIDEDIQTERNAREGNNGSEV